MSLRLPVAWTLAVAVAAAAPGFAATPDATPPAAAPFLGVLLEDDFPQLAGTDGVPVVECLEGSAAWRAGLEPGDRLLEVAGRPVQDGQEVGAALAQHAVGDRVQVTFLRDAERWVTTVRLDARPAEPEPPAGAILVQEEPPGEAPVEPSAETAPESGTEVVLASARDEPHGWLGVEVEERPEGPLVLVDVEAGSPADRSGLKTGDELVKADGAKLADLAALGRVLDERHPDEIVTFAFRRGDDLMQTKVRLGSRETGAAGGGEESPLALAALPAGDREARLEARVDELEARLAERDAALARLETERAELAARLDRQAEVLEGIRKALEDLRRDGGARP